MAAQGVSTFGQIREPVQDKDGKITRAWIKKFQEWESKLNQTITLFGQLEANVIIQGRTEGIGTTVGQLDAGGIVVASGVDFSRAYINKNLANIPDSAMRKAVLAVDANARAIIDFSQAGHVSKTIDSIPDGATNGSIGIARRDASTSLAGNLILKNITNPSASTSGPTTASVLPTFVDLAEMTQTVTTKGNFIFAVFSLSVGNTASAATTFFQLLRDGSPIGSVAKTASPTGGQIVSTSMSWIDGPAGPPAAGAHIYKIQWCVSSGTATADGINRAFQVVELG